MANLTKKQKDLFDALHQSRAEDFKTFNKKSYRGVWGSIIDKYPESAHFIYELLQNADDAEATEVYIILKRDRILFKHNGSKHFDITTDEAEPVGDINSITGIGDSSKVDTQNKIGKFGVGFKAVFQYTDTPEIYDDVFKFKIENFIIPTLLPYDHPERKEGETLFVFPFKNEAKSYQEILRRLDKLQNPILFLHHIQSIKWRVDRKKDIIGTEIGYSKEIIDKIEYDDGILLERYKLIEPLKNNEIFLFSQDVDITDDDDVKTTHVINVGFYYDAVNKRLVTENKQNIYCFFPTKETFQTCFVSHAPFLLTDNRQNLKPDEKLNRDLIDLLAELATKAVVYLRDYDTGLGQLLINENLTEIIPNYTKNYWHELDLLFELPIKEAFEEILKEERLLLSRNGKYLSMKEAYKGSPRELVDLLSQKQLADLLKEELEENFDYLDDDVLLEVDDVDFLKWELAQNINSQRNELYDDIEDFSSEAFARLITGEFMDKQPMRWVTRMYTFLRTAAPKLWKITEKDKKNTPTSLPFRSAPIIKTQRGEWVPPFVDNVNPNVYLPLKDRNESEYNFIAEEYLNNEMARKFFSELDIKEPDEDDYIRQVVLAKYQGEEFEVDDGVIQADFEILLNHYLKVKDRSGIGENFILLLRNNLWIVGDNGNLNRPNILYFEHDLLKSYFADKEDIVFANLDFYSSTVEKYGINNVKDFLSRLGVRSYPSIEKKRRYSKWGLVDRLRIQIPTDGYQEHTIEDDYELKGFDEFCKSRKKSRDVSIYLWNTVLPALYFSKYENLKLRFRRKYARSYEYAYYISSFKDALIHERWLVDVNGRFVSAKNIAFEDLDPEYDRNNGLIQFLGIEKREKSIIELGGTEEQQEQMDLGRRLKNLAGDDLTEEEMIQVVAEAKAKKKGGMSVDKPSSDTGQDTTESTQPPKKKKTDEHKPENTAKPSPALDSTSDAGNDTDRAEILVDDEPIPVFIDREELRKTDILEMFTNGQRKNTPEKDVNEVAADDSSDETVDSVMQKLIEQEEKQDKIKALREAASKAEKYSKEWFDALIELEYRGGVETDKGDATKAINISFASVRKEPGSERIYVFEHPSRGIPMWLEEVGDIEVKCKFSDRDELKLKFEVANVRDSSLRLKASKIYESILNKIDWSTCSRASITLKNQIDLMGKLRTAFNGLELESGFNLKDNLDDNIKFIFGPPGTGKTTNIAKKIISFMRDGNTSYRILVLAPTNTACDELARKIQEISDGDCSWLYRFISTADENLEDIVIDRESTAYDEDKCCIISTMARLSFDGFNGPGDYYKLLDLVWDMIICDEASMIPLAEMALAIYNYLNTPILIAGDPMQIKPILREEEWKDENIYTMVKLDKFDHPVTEPIQFEIENLDTQYRSVPAIGELFSRYAYDGKLKHHRSAIPNKMFGQIEMKPINFIPFKVERYDSIFGVKKLDGSNVHIYSVLFTVEMFKYVAQKYSETTDENLSIGIVCPYSPQAQLIESLIAQIPNIPSNISITVGTVHRFQGGQCNMMFVVLNPPLGIKVASERIFLNNKNILNVAISRAQDYLCILLPHRDTEGYEYLYEINTIGRIAMQKPEFVASYTCDEIEETIFGHKFYIESNTFVTSHQLTNVYTKAVKMFEVRIDEKSVDIQLGATAVPVIQRTGANSVQEEMVDTASVVEEANTESQKYIFEPKNEEHCEHDDLTSEIEKSRLFTEEVQYYSFFDKNEIDLDEAIEVLITANTITAIYVLVKIFGDAKIAKRFQWRVPRIDDITSNKSYCATYKLFDNIYPQLFFAVRQNKLAIKNIGNKNIAELSLEEFTTAFESHIERKKTKPKKTQKNSTTSKLSKNAPTNYYNTYRQERPNQERTGKLYSDYEYGLSDW